MRRAAKCAALPLSQMLQTPRTNSISIATKYYLVRGQRRRGGGSGTKKVRSAFLIARNRANPFSDAVLDASDEEILGYSSESENDDEEEEDVAPTKPRAIDSDDEGGSEEEEPAEGWGASKKEYYNNDAIETEAHALEEEAEAKRLQQKKLQKMSDADFGFDESEWLDGGDEDEEGDVVTEVLKDIEITSDMSPKDRLRILQTRYPEFEFLANEFLELQPLLVELQQQAEAEPPRKSTTGTSMTVIKCRALAAYMGCLGMYFTLLTSPAKGGKGEGRPMDPAELRDHAVMDSLLQCRELWSKVKSLKSPIPIDDASLAEEEVEPEESITKSKSKSSKSTSKPKSAKKLAKLAAAEEEAALRLQRIRATSEELQNLSTKIPTKLAKRTKAVEVKNDNDDNSDFGEEESMDEKAAAAKATKKKSLRFYTSQIVQKSNKRADAGRDAGGDNDLPVKERFRDRQQRLNAEAEARGRKMDSYGRGNTALGGESGSEDEGVADKVREDEDEYYDMVSKTQKKKKSDKDTQQAADAQAIADEKMDRVVEGGLDEDGKRAIGYVIQKNKGLAPKRKKEVRNPRVKKRMKFEEKKKKLSSMKATYKGGEERGGYGGEKTGIKSGLIKSIKL